MIPRWIKMLSDSCDYHEAWYLLDPDKFKHNEHITNHTDTKSLRLYVTREESSPHYIIEADLFTGFPGNRTYLRQYTGLGIINIATILDEIDAMRLIQQL